MARPPARWESCAVARKESRDAVVGRHSKTIKERIGRRHGRVECDQGTGVLASFFSNAVADRNGYCAQAAALQGTGPGHGVFSWAAWQHLGTVFPSDARSASCCRRAIRLRSRLSFNIFSLCASPRKVSKVEEFARRKSFLVVLEPTYAVRHRSALTNDEEPHFRLSRCRRPREIYVSPKDEMSEVPCMYLVCTVAFSELTRQKAKQQQSSRLLPVYWVWGP